MPILRPSQRLPLRAPQCLPLRGSQCGASLWLASTCPDRSRTAAPVARAARPRRRGPAAIAVVSLFAFLSACNVPAPRAWLRFEPSGGHVWQQPGPGRLESTVLGARLQVDLHRRDTQIRLELRNDTGRDLAIALGPEVRRGPTAAIGELQRKPLDGSRGEDVPDFVPYVSMQQAEVRDGYLATFHLDNPLGREVVLGQYLVLVVEARDSGGAFERRLLPLVATNAGAR